MKKLVKLVIASVFVFLIVPESAFAQGPPPWAPAHGYRAKTRHVYFPDHNVYFDLKKRVYLTHERGAWISLQKPPRIFAGINLGAAPKVELDFVGDRPYRYNSAHIVKYKKTKKLKAKKVMIYNNHDNDHDHKEHHGHKHGGKHGKH